MTKKLLLLFAALCCCTSMLALPAFETGKKYRLVCDQFGGSGVATGQQHGSTALLYYDTSGNLPADAFWYVTKSTNGYLLQNVATLEYAVYDPVRVEGVCKGISLSPTADGDEALWNFQQTGDSYYIINVARPEQWFNVRVDGSYLVGTYDTHGGRAENECFKFYDETGALVPEAGSGGITPSDDFAEKWGVTTEGAYWERTGLQAPVVFTTDLSDPVLYTIRNVRSGNYLQAKDKQLLQATGDATEFYFTQGTDGAQIYTREGKCVSGWINTADLLNSPVTLVDGPSATGDNTWEFGFFDGTTAGYTVGVRTCNANTQWEIGGQTFWNDYHNDFIGFYTVDEGSTFIFLSSDVRHAEYLAAQGIDFGDYAPNRFSNYVADLKINGKTPTYDTQAEIYYFTLPSSLRGGGTTRLSLSGTWLKGGNDHVLCLDDAAPDGTDGTVLLESADCTRDHEISVRDSEGKTLASATLRFTFLPIVEVNVTGCNSNYYTPGTFRVNDGNFLGDAETLHAKFRWRGATALGYEKKSYAVKLTDANGEDLDASFLGMRDDNNWILDAMAIDHACMRNRVATDLWNDFARAPYYKDKEPGVRTGTRGTFVEVFLNGRYHGLYCFTEKIDRKQLKLKKYEAADGTHDDIIHGTLYKSNDWTYEVFMGHESGQRYYPKRAPGNYNNYNRSETWAGYEIKYPDYEDEPIDWSPLYDAINFVATASNDDFDNQIHNYFDRPPLDDYYLLIELSLATDNHGKNMHYFVYDQQAATNARKLSLGPWDLDGSWGRRWDGSSYYTVPEQDFDTFLWTYEHGNLTLFTRLHESEYLCWDLGLANRYAALRKTYFAPEALKQRFTDYLALFDESGATGREAQRWPSLHYDIGSDVEYICNWIDRRVAFLDEQYGYVPSTDGIADAPDRQMGVSGGNGCISFRLSQPQRLLIYSLSGTLVRSLDAPAGHSRIDGLAPGIYITGGQKVIVR